MSVACGGFTVGLLDQGVDMQITFDVTAMPPRDRAEALRTAIWDAVVHVEIDHHLEAGRIAATGLSRQVGDLTVFSAESSALTIRRTPVLAREDVEPCLILGLQRSGTSAIIQDERQVALSKGDMNLVDTTRPFTSINPTGAHQHYFRIPRADLALPDHVISGVTTVRLGADNPVAGLASAYLERLARNSVAISAIPGSTVVDRPSIELIRAMITTQVGADSLARAPLEDSLALRIMEYARAHLGDRDLSGPRIARAHGISSRHMYAVLARSDIQLGEWIRMRRLENCRRELAEPPERTGTVAVIGRRWGFADATNFGRAFRQGYGMSPRDWRERRS
jgi:AraC-like DNA-binding protein